MKCLLPLEETVTEGGVNDNFLGGSLCRHALKKSNWMISARGGMDLQLIGYDECIALNPDTVISVADLTRR